MDSNLIVEKYEATLKGQQLLFPDADIILRQTKFKKIDPEFDKQALVHWWMNVYVPDGYGENRAPQNVFSSWSNAMWGCFQVVHVSGYCPENEQSTVHFGAYEKEPLEPQIEELRMWVPHIKPVKLDFDRPAKMIKVSEAGCGEGGIWSLRIYSDTEYVLGLRRYSHYHERAKFESLGKAVWFISQHYPYKKRYWKAGEDE